MKFAGVVRSALLLFVAWLLSYFFVDILHISLDAMMAGVLFITLIIFLMIGVKIIELDMRVELIERKLGISREELMKFMKKLEEAKRHEH